MGKEEKETPPPTPAQVIEIRERFRAHMDKNKDDDDFDPRDVTELFENDLLVHRYFIHSSDLFGSNTDHVVSVIVSSLKWRKETGIRDLGPADLNPRLLEKGSLYLLPRRNRDRDGKRLLVLDVKKHVRGMETAEDLRRFFNYFVERINREEDGGQMSLVFDCAGCGVRNIDLGMVQYMVSVLKNYTPCNLNHVLVLEMPWVLNAAWRIVKGWLPQSTVGKVMFVDKEGMDEFVGKGERLVGWGGEDGWVYEFEQEEEVEEEK